jgi:purine-cytosine permease-like protein
MGWWPSRLCVLLNIVIMLGYGLIDILAAGQILSAVNGAGLTIITGTVISAVLSLAIVLFGIGVFHKYERYAWMPQLAAIFILAGVAGPKFDAATITESTGAEAAAERMSYFWLCASSTIAWSPATADFYVYFPPTTNRWMTWLCTTVGITLSVTIMVLFGAGLGSGISINPAWSDANDVSMGALIVEAYAPLGAFGHFCAVILSLGLISNNVPSTYSAALSFQLLGRWFEQIPRIFWCVISAVIYTVCACVGRDVLFVVFSNFLALMGYWTLIWVSLTLVEEFMFRRNRGGYDWTAWNVPKRLPIGLAALVAFLVGWVGAILGMWQTYYTGPLAKLVGEGIDMGMPVGAAWAVVVFIPLRWLELKYVGR